MSQEKRHYLSYLLRLRRANEQGEPVWRISLQSSHTHECKDFAGLDDLFVFLWEQTGQSPEVDKNRSETGE